MYKDDIGPSYQKVIGYNRIIEYPSCFVLKKKLCVNKTERALFTIQQREQYRPAASASMPICFYDQMSQ